MLGTPRGHERAGRRQDIRDLYGRYIHSLRLGDADALADCFTADASLWLGDQRIEGRDRIRELLIQMAPGRPRHHTSDLWVSSMRGQAARCLAHVVLLDPTDGATVAFGTYEDVVVREPDGQWRWRKRHITLDWTAESYRRTPVV